jgi:hypothetical protein
MPRSGKHVVDRSPQALGRLCSERGQRRCALEQRLRRRPLAILERAKIEVGGVHQIKLAARGTTRFDHVRERGAVFLRETKQQIAASADLFEPLRIELDAGLVLGQLACERLEIVVRRYRTAPEPAERGIDALDRRQHALDRRQPLQHRLLLTLDALDDSRRQRSQLSAFSRRRASSSRRASSPSVSFAVSISCTTCRR